MKEYIGRNSKSDYAKTRIYTWICYTIYSLLGVVLMTFLLTITIMRLIKYDDLVIIFWILVIVLGFLELFIVAAFVTSFVLVIKFIKEMLYYKKLKLTNVSEIVIPFDTKLWLTAPKDTFHPMSFRMVVDGEERFFKSAIIFTNSSSYYKLPKFKMPEVLMSKNYIKNYAIVGYDPINDEGIVINFRIPNE